MATLLLLFYTNEDDNMLFSENYQRPTFAQQFKICIIIIFFPFQYVGDILVCFNKLNKYMFRQVNWALVLGGGRLERLAERREARRVLAGAAAPARVG